MPLYRRVHIGFAQQDKDQACGFPWNVGPSFLYLHFIKRDSADAPATCCQHFPLLSCLRHLSLPGPFYLCFLLQIAPRKTNSNQCGYHTLHVACVWSKPSGEQWKTSCLDTSLRRMSGGICCTVEEKKEGMGDKSHPVGILINSEHGTCEGSVNGSCVSCC